MLKSLILMIVNSILSDKNLPTQAKAPSCITANPQDYFNAIIHYDEVGYMRDCFVDMAQKIQDKLKLNPPNPYCFKLTKIRASSGWWFCSQTKILVDSDDGKKKAQKIEKVADQMMSYFIVQVPIDRVISWDDQGYYAQVIIEARRRLLISKQLNHENRSIKKLTSLELHLNPGIQTYQQFEDLVLRNKLLVVVIFYQPNYQESLNFIKTVESVIGNMGSLKVPLIKINVGMMVVLTVSYKVQNIPSLLLFKNGEEVRDYRTYASDSVARLLEIFQNIAFFITQNRVSEALRQLG